MDVPPNMSLETEMMRESLKNEDEIKLKPKAVKIPKPEKKIEKINRPPLKFTESFSIKVVGGILAVWSFFQVTMMYLYIHYPQYDGFINRFSLSDAQALGLAALVVAAWGVWRQEQYLWQKFGVRMGVENQPGGGNEAESLQLERLSEMLIPLQKVLLTIEDQMKEKDIKTEDVITLIQNMFKYEKEIKKWTERMEKLMPIFEGLASSVENVDQKQLGTVIGRRVGDILNEELNKIKAEENALKLAVNKSEK